MPDALPPLIAVLRADSKQFVTSMKEAGSATKKVTDETGKTSTVAKTNFERMAGAGKAMAVGIVGSAVVVGGAALKMGMDFQESMTSLVTGAGESEKNIGKVGDGILAMSGKVGQSGEALASGMYLIESAGYHGADGLKVLQAAAEGAKVGNADMKTVADGVTTALTDYGLKATDAATVTSKLVKTVASGKTNMADLAGSLATVLPVASTAKVGLDQVLGAMATMTAKGTPAADAATYLKQTIAQLSNPTTKAAGEMKALGLSSIDVAQNLGKRGLTGTMDLLTSAIASKMGPQGTVLIDTLKKGATSAGGLQSAISKLPPTQQTYVAALADMVGGTKSMQAALMLTGDSAATFKTNVHNIGEASAVAGGHVEGFAETQKDLKNKLENAKDGAMAMVTALGMKLIPVVTKVLGVATTWGNWLVAHKPVLIAVAAVIGGVMVTAIGLWIASMLTATVTIGSFEMMAAPLIGIILLIVAAVAGLVIGIYELATHWKQVWGAIKDAAAAVWDWLKGAFDWIKTIFFDGIKLYIDALKLVWGTAWNVIKGAVSAVWDFLKGAWDWLSNRFMNGLKTDIGFVKDAWSKVWNGIKSAVSTVWDWLKGAWDWISSRFIGGLKTDIAALGKVWKDIWDGIGSAVQWVYDHTIKPVVDLIKKAIGGVTSVVSGVKSAAGAVGHFFGFDNGGLVPGPKGAPMLAVVHGGEYVLSNDMLAGRQEATDLTKSARSANGYTAASPSPSLSQRALTGGSQAAVAAPAPQVTVIAHTNADPQRIGAQVGWVLRGMA